MDRTVLLTLGRFPKALTLARGLHRQGARVIVADPLKRHICSVSRAVAKCYQVTAPNDDLLAWQTELLAIIESEQVTDVIPISEEICHVGNLAAQLPKTVRYVGPSAQWLAQWHDKLGFVAHAINRGVTAPSVYMANDPDTRGLIRQTDCVLKPRRGCSGTEVSFVRRGSALPPASSDMLLQRKVEGSHLCTLSWVKDGVAIATASYRGTTYSGTVAVGFQSAATPFSVRQWIDQFLANTNTTGFISFDFILDRAGIPWGIECNPRLSSGIHFMDEAWMGGAALDLPQGSGSISTAGKRAQWGYSTLTEAYKYLFRLRIAELIRCLRDFFLSRDVVWSWRDPLPFLLMTPLSWELIWTSFKERISLGDASQRDVAWHWFETRDQAELGVTANGDQRES